MATGGARPKKTAGYRSRSDTPLHKAAEDGDLSEVKRLVRSGADTGAQDDVLGWTPIMWAVRNGHRSVVEYLVTVMSAGDLDVVDDDEWNVLHCIALCRRPWSRLVECITDKSPNTLLAVDRWGDRPIDLARRDLPLNQQVYATLDQLTQKQEQIQQQQQQQQYQTGISSNVENPCDITVTVVGHQGVGKSCLVNQLKKEPFPKHGPGSTNTADFSVNYLGYNPDTGYRQKLDGDGEIQSERQRLKRIIDQHQQEEKEKSKVDNKSTSEKSDKESRHIDEDVTEIKTVTPSAEQKHVTENVPPSKEQGRVIGEVPPSKEQTHGIEEALPSPEQRRDIEEVLPCTEQRRDIEEVLPCTEQRRGLEEVQPSTEQRRAIEIVPPSMEQRHVIEEVPPSTEHRCDIEEVPPSTEQRRGLEEALPSPEQRRDIEEVLPSPKQRHVTENIPPSTKHRCDTEEVLPSTEHRCDIEEVLPSTEQSRGREEVPPSTKQRRGLEEVPPSTEQRRGLEEVPPSTEHRCDIEEVPPSTEQRRGLEEVPPSTEQSRGLEEVPTSTEDKCDIEEVPPSTEQRRGLEEVPPSTEHRCDIEEVPPSKEQRRGLEEVPPSTEHRCDTEEVLPSMEQKRGLEEVPPSTEQRHVKEEVPPSPEQRHVTKNVPPSKEQRQVIEEVMSTQMDKFDDKDLKGYITIYDFGGEKVFYNTHHCFMSSNMVFVLVFDVAMCLDPRRSKNGYEMIEFWLKAFATYAVDEVKDKGTPPVILVGSHLDQVSPKRKQEDLFQTVLDKLYEKPEIREIIETHVKEIFPVANLNDFTENKETYERMWNKIIEIAPFQSQWMKPIPARWVALEYELVRLKRKGKVILTYDDLLAMNHKLAVPLPEDDIMNFLRKLRFAGSFLCFDLHSRNPFIVLQPQWIIDAFKAIITDPKFTTGQSPKLRLQWKEYAKSGVLRYDVIQQLWGFSATYPFLEEEDKLFISMETLGLMTKPLSDDTEVDYFIVPSILQNADPELFRPILHDSGTVTTVTLCIKFDNQFIPQAIWDKMIASCIHRFQRPREFGNDDQTYVQDGLACLPQAIWDNMIANCFHWFHRPRWHGIDVHKYVQRGLACLRVDPMWNMIINCRDNTMKVTMFKKDTDNNVLPGTGINLLKILEFLLKQILELNQQSHLKYQFYLHNDFRFTANDELVKVEDLQHYERLQCHGSKGIDWIDRNDLHVWFKNPNPKAAPIHKGFQDILKEIPDRKLSYKEIGRVSKYFGSTYQTFFVELDCPITLVEQEMEEHRHLTFRSRIAKIFIQLGNTKADIGFLAIADAMSRHGMDPKLLMDILDSNRDVSFKDETLSEGWLNKDLSVIDAKIIVDHIDIKAYFNLFLELGCTPRMVDEFDDQYRNKKAPEKIAALLEAFIQETNPRPTVNGILLAMQECNMNTESLITALKKRQG